MTQCLREFAFQATEDPYDLEAVHAIDEKLAKIIPESEWEAEVARFFLDHFWN